MDQSPNDLVLIVRSLLSHLAYLHAYPPRSTGVDEEVLSYLIFERKTAAFEDALFDAMPTLQGLWNHALPAGRDRPWDEEWMPSCLNVGYWLRCDVNVYHPSKIRIETLLKDLLEAAKVISAGDSEKIRRGGRPRWDDLTDREQQILLALASAPERALSGKEIAKLANTSPGVVHKLARRLKELYLIEKVPTGYRLLTAAEGSPFEVLSAIGQRT